MARQLRKLADDSIYHVLNRSSGRRKLFGKRGDFEEFLGLLEEGRKKIGLRILGYCLMEDHWHLVVWPRKGRDLSKFVGWVCTSQVRRWRERRGERGGNLYAARFRSFMVQGDEHFLTVMRFVESNPVRVRKVKKAEAWEWSSLGGKGVELAKWPVQRPRDWRKLVNAGVGEEEIERVRVSIKRSRPFGGEKWVGRVVKRVGLEGTMRDPWRPRKKAGAGRRKG